MILEIYIATYADSFKNVFAKGNCSCYSTLKIKISFIEKLICFIIRYTIKSTIKSVLILEVGVAIPNKQYAFFLRWTINNLLKQYIDDIQTHFIDENGFVAESATPHYLKEYFC